MSDANATAPNAAPSPASSPAPTGGADPSATPNPGADTQPGPEGNPSAATQQALIDLAAMDPTTRVALVVDGKRVEMSAAEAFKRLGRAESANKRFAEAAQREAAAKREMDEFIAKMSRSIGDPGAFAAELREMGLTPMEYARALLAHEEREAALTPEQRKLREYEQREAAREAEAKAAEERAYETQKAEIRNAYAQRFGELLTKHGIPEDSSVRDYIMPQLFRAAAYLRRGDETRGIKPQAMNTDHVAAIVKKCLSDFGAVARPPAPAPAQPAKPEAAPPTQPRDANGRYVAPSAQNGNGPRPIRRVSDVFGGRI